MILTIARPLTTAATLAFLLCGAAAQDKPTAPAAPPLEAVLLEPKAGASDRNMLETKGQVSWSLSPGKVQDGKSGDPSIKGRIEFPEAKLILDITLRRNKDPSLAASHVATLVFSGADSINQRRVKDFGGIELRTTPAAGGKFLRGIPISLGDNAFGLALFKTDLDMRTNIDLLKTQNWFAFPVLYSSGGRATIVFSKGPNGEHVFADAFQTWGE